MSGLFVVGYTKKGTEQKQIQEWMVACRGRKCLEGRLEKQLICRFMSVLAFSALKCAHIAFPENKIESEISSQGSSEVPSVPCLSCNDSSFLRVTGHLWLPDCAWWMYYEWRNRLCVGPPHNSSSCLSPGSLRTHAPPPEKASLGPQSATERLGFFLFGLFYVVC